MNRSTSPPPNPPPLDVPPLARWPRRPRQISVVCPVYREAEGIGVFTGELLRVLDGLGIPFEVIFVEDDSPDATLEELRRLHGERPKVIKVLSMSRRFGHQSSLAAGLRYADGQVVICMDSDLQHPPGLLPEMLYLWAQGNQLVYTRRRRQAGRSRLKEAASRWFYRVMGMATHLPFEEGTADFRLTDEIVVDALNRFGERSLLFRGLVTWIGFRRSVIDYDAPPRFAGTTNFSWGRLLRMGLDGLFAFSLLPLRFSFFFGFLAMVACGLYGVYSLVNYFSGRVDVPGYTSLVLLVSFLGSLNLLCLGIVGEYVGRIHEQVKDRPLYLVKEWIGLDPDDEHPRKRRS